MTPHEQEVKDRAEIALINIKEHNWGYLYSLNLASTGAPELRSAVRKELNKLLAKGKRRYSDY